MPNTSTTSELKDIPDVHRALNLFLNSQMLESEQLLGGLDKKRLYSATGYGLIQCVKALLSHEDQDLLVGIEHAKSGNVVADEYRRKNANPIWRALNKATDGLTKHEPEWYKSMTLVERHAELAYVESLTESALLTVVRSRNLAKSLWEAPKFVKVVNKYFQLKKFIDAMDADKDESIDADFRTGVYLGVGWTHILLSMLPGYLRKPIGFLGYEANRKTGLKLLEQNGGWSSDPAELPIPKESEGLRRPLSDMFLLVFHLVFSEFTFEGVDLNMAQRITDWNLERYPNGIFLLFAQGRLSFLHNEPAKSIECHKKATKIEHEYKNLKLISYWEMALANLALWDIRESLESWVELKAKGSWSKVIYAYGVAVCTLHLYGDKKQEISKSFGELLKLDRGIAGAKIPQEEFVARRAEKFEKQGGQLCLAALELAYVFNGIAHAPRDVVVEKMLPQTKAELDKLNDYQDKPKEWCDGKANYWDDYCLCRFLEGVCERYLAYQDPAAASKDDAEDRLDHAKRAEDAFEAVLSKGKKIGEDHHLVFHTHFEYGRLLACQGKKDEASKRFGYVDKGNAPESKQKGGYDLEDALKVKTFAATEALKIGHRL